MHGRASRQGGGSTRESCVHHSLPLHMSTLCLACMHASLLCVAGGGMVSVRELRDCVLCTFPAPRVVDVITTERPHEAHPIYVRGARSPECHVARKLSFAHTHCHRLLSLIHAESCIWGFAAHLPPFHFTTGERATPSLSAEDAGQYSASLRTKQEWESC